MTFLRTVRAFLVTVAVAAAAVGGGVAHDQPSAEARTLAPPPKLRLVPLRFSFESPIWAGGPTAENAIYVAEQGGRVYRIANGRRALLLDVSRLTSAGGEQGLLSIAFAHDYTAVGGRMWLYYTLPNGNGRVAQYTVRRGVIVAGSGRVTMNVPLSPPTESNHNGGQLWSRSGNDLFLSVGDGGGGGDPEGNGQDFGTLMGKLLRIRPRANGGYLIPKDNPFVSRAGARKEVWALGLRNAWRYSFDSTTGDLWIGDVGQGEQEEIDVLPASHRGGANFGWGRFEGRRVFDSSVQLASGTTHTAPRITYSHDRGGCSVTGGVVYRGPTVNIRGWYLYADFCTDTVTAYHPTTRRLGASDVDVPGIVHFGEGGAARAVYAASQQTGKVYLVGLAASR